jgi:hypothetical protein
MDTTAKWCPFCRQEVIERVDEHGLSVATSPEAATAGFDAKGMIEIDTDKFPPEYSIILDPDDANHQLIRGLPFDLRQDNNDEQESEVVKHANALRACARVVPLPGLKP